MFENHFWSLGFQIKSSEEYKDLALLAVQKSHVAAARGKMQYECWSLGNIELWVHTTESSDGTKRQIMNLSPHYAGTTRLRAMIRERVSRENDGPLERAYLAEVVDDGYPFVFDAPFVGSELTTPLQAVVQITGFAHSLEVFDDEAAHQSANGPKKGWASRAFVPCGMFEPSGTPIEPPKSIAIIAGIVQSAKQEANPATGKGFQSAVVSSYLADYDIVVGLDVCERRLEAGNVVVGTFWLSGKFA